MDALKLGVNDAVVDALPVALCVGVAVLLAVGVCVGVDVPLRVDVWETVGVPARLGETDGVTPDDNAAVEVADDVMLRLTVLDPVCDGVFELVFVAEAVPVGVIVGVPVAVTLELCVVDALVEPESLPVDDGDAPRVSDAVAEPETVEL